MIDGLADPAASPAHRAASGRRGSGAVPALLAVLVAAFGPFATRAGVLSPGVGDHVVTVTSSES